MVREGGVRGLSENLTDGEDGQKSDARQRIKKQREDDEKMADPVHMHKPGKKKSFQGYARSLSGPREAGVWLAAQIPIIIMIVPDATTDSLQPAEIRLNRRTIIGKEGIFQLRPCITPSWSASSGVPAGNVIRPSLHAAPSTQ